MRAAGRLTEPLVKVVAQWAALVLCSGAGPCTNDRAAHQAPPGALGLFPAAAGRCCGAMDCASAPDASPPARGGSVVLPGRRRAAIAGLDVLEHVRSPIHLPDSQPRPSHQTTSWEPIRSA